MVSTTLLVVGALLVGEALHGGVVTREFAVTSPYVVIRILLGGVFIALGYRLRSPVEEYVEMPSGEPSRSGDASNDSPATDQSQEADRSGEFDPELSPLGGDGLEHVDADEDDVRRDDRNDGDRAATGDEGE
ncbi:hypothetical protein [Halorussus salinus]|uniref:hypothetical protein n=1 Tax=Halorussus salinus TaxID=1364935 RepID=UPI001091D706|nr:hypothetical protein [Halorussus salinus]